MPPIKFRIIIQTLSPDSDDLIVHEEPVRCPGCGNTVLNKPRTVALTYDITCSRCNSPHRLSELTFNFRYKR